MQNVSNIANVQQPQPQQQNYATAPIQQPNPNYAGVNIQIFNPMVGTPQGTVYPQQTGSAYASGTQGGCYPAGYYTGQYPAGTFVPQNPYGTPQNGGSYDMNTYYPPNPNGYPVPGTNSAAPQNSPSATETSTEAPQNTAVSGSDSAKTDSKTTDDNAENSDNTVQTTSDASKAKEQTEQNDKTTDKKDEISDKNGKKTEKRKIVELSDDYIKTLENYLNSQDSEVRLMGAKEVVSRAMEDDSRKDDPALTALVNKMLQDPSSAIRAIALSLIDSRTILGNDYTVNVLKKMQTSKDGFGQDSVQATSALLKMAGKTVEKEFEVKETPKKDKK